MTGFGLTDKVAIITGGSRGIGRAIALAYADAGAKVVITSRKQEGLDTVAEEIRERGGAGRLWRSPRTWAKKRPWRTPCSGRLTVLVG